MIISFKDKYNRLQQSLEDCRQQACNHTQMIETGFKVCFTFYGELEKEINTLNLKAKEWILLNKSVRPLFLSRIEYYVLLYHAAFFCPLEKEAAIRFWMQELMRLDRFCQEHSDFYHYHSTGSAHLDAAYFSCPGTEANDKTCGTLLLAKLLALEDYIPYVKNQLLGLGIK